MEALWTPVALNELEEICERDSRTEVAEKIYESIRDKANWYAKNAKVGQRHPDLPDSWRYFVVKRWVAVYLPTETGITVLRVIDGARDFSRMFP